MQDVDHLAGVAIDITNFSLMIPWATSDTSAVYRIASYVVPPAAVPMPAEVTLASFVAENTPPAGDIRGLIVSLLSAAGPTSGGDQQSFEEDDSVWKLDWSVMPDSPGSTVPSLSRSRSHAPFVCSTTVSRSGSKPKVRLPSTSLNRSLAT